MHLRYLIALLFSTSACLAQPATPCTQPLDAALYTGATLTIDSRSAGIEIVPTDSDAQTIHITCQPNDSESDADNAAHTRLQLSGSPTHTKLTVTGPHLDHGGLKLRIELPRKVNLDIHMPAGQVTVNDIVGDKNIDLDAGQITISSTHKWNYKDVDVEVLIGQVSAPVYNADKGGFFRDLHRQNSDGEYRLRAHVVTGQIQLLGKPTHTATYPQ